MALTLSGVSLIGRTSSMYILENVSSTLTHRSTKGSVEIRASNTRRLCAPILLENEKLVDQYRSGNDKVLNALIGKFLKSNKGYDPKEVKDELMKLLGN